MDRDSTTPWTANRLLQITLRQQHRSHLDNTWIAFYHTNCGSPVHIFDNCRARARRVLPGVSQSTLVADGLPKRERCTPSWDSRRRRPRHSVLTSCSGYMHLPSLPGKGEKARRRQIREGAALQYMLVLSLLHGLPMLMLGA